MDRKLSLLGFAVMFLIGSDTFVVAPLMPSLAKAFNVSTTQSGWLVSVYAIGYALTGLVSGPISDRGNRRIILTLGMVVFALATATCAVSPGFWTMFIFRFITGGAAAVAAPQVWAMIPALVGPDQKTFCASWDIRPPGCRSLRLSGFLSEVFSQSSTGALSSPLSGSARWR